MVKVDWAGQMMWLVRHANEQDILLGPRFSKKKKKKCASKFNSYKISTYYYFSFFKKCYDSGIVKFLMTRMVKSGILL